MPIDSSKTLKVIMILVVTTLCQACAVTINPHNFTINNQASPHLSQLTQGSITIKSQPIETSGRAIPVAGFNITVNENEFTKVLVGKLKRSYCQMWCMASSSGVLFLIGNLFKSIDEFNAGYNIS